VRTADNCSARLRGIPSREDAVQLGDPRERWWESEWVKMGLVLEAAAAADDDDVSVSRVRGKLGRDRQTDRQTDERLDTHKQFTGVLLQ